MHKRCKHNKQKRYCKECGGSALCIHGRYRWHCVDCHGSQICVHNKNRHVCQECGDFCKHGTRRSRCIECNGNSVCVHKRLRHQCRECGSGLFCEHDRRRTECTRCRPEVTFTKYKSVAKNRGYSFELTFSEFEWLVSSPCSSCGEVFEPIGVDRVDSNHGYRFDNCQPMCEMCNRMKLDYSEEEFDQRLIKIIQHRPELAERAGFHRV